MSENLSSTQKKTKFALSFRKEYNHFFIKSKISKLMTIREIVKLLGATVCTGEERLDEDVETAFASDLMSDVLTLKDTPMLVTGLCNVQTIRTCDMASLDIILVVRNKKVTEDMIELAEDDDMVILSCAYSMFKVCGLLYQNGIKPLY